MKKFDWKKALVLLVAFVLVFSLAACGNGDDDKKPTTDEVPVADFLHKLVDGVGGYVDALGSEKGVRHIDAKVVVQVGTEGKAVGTAANYEVRIAANLDATTSDYAKNDALIEVKDLNDADKNKVVLAIYATGGKVYLRESFSTADGSEQQLKIEDITAFQYQQYLAMLPELMESLLNGFNLEETIGGAIDGLAAPALKSLLKVTKSGNNYIAVLNIDGLGEILGMVTSLVDLQPYRNIVNLILPSVLGVTLNADNTLSKGKTTPEITLNVNMNDKEQFNGLTFDYKWPKKDGSGNDVSVHVGLTDIAINNDSAAVTEGLSFDNYKDGAVKVSAKIAIPGLSDNGFDVSADFYLKPGFNTILGNAASENEVLKIQLTAKKDGQSYPLTAQYKYEDKDGKRGGRLYFEMGALTDLAGIDTTGMATKYYVDIDIAEFLIASATPTQVELEVEGLPSDYTAKAFFKPYKNKDYYTKHESFNDGLLWAGLEVKKGGATVGTDIGYGREEKATEVYTDILLDGKTYRVTVSDEDMLKKMKGDNTVKAKAVEVQKEVAKSANVAVYDANNNLLADNAARKEGYYYRLNVYSVDGTIIDKAYYFYMATEIGGTESDVMTEEIGDRLADIFDIVKKDLSAYAKPGFDIDVRGIWKVGPSKDGLKAVDAATMKNDVGGKVELKEYNTKTGSKGRGLFQVRDEANFKLEADLLLVQSAKMTAEELYTQMVADGTLDSYIAEGLVRLQNGTTDIPAISSDIQVNNGQDFAFDIGGVGGLIQKLMDKLSGMMETNSITIGLEDAKDILDMGAYLNTNKLFAAQIRMLLSNEKQSDEFNKLAVYAPYATPKKTVASDVTSFTGTNKANVVEEAVKHNTYLHEANYLYSIYKVYGNKTEAELKTELGLDGIADNTTVGLEGWTNADVKGYVDLKSEQEKAEYYFDKMRATYVKRVEKHDAAYAEYRVQMEEKAMKAIRGYIGANGVLPESVKTVENFLFGEAITITLEFGKSDANVINGMPLSLRFIIKRGTQDIVKMEAGVQFIDATTIPTTEIPEDYWNDAVEVSTGYDKEGNYKYADVVVLLLKVHAKFAGFDSWMDVVGVKPAA